MSEAVDPSRATRSYVKRAVAWAAHNAHRSLLVIFLYCTVLMTIMFFALQAQGNSNHRRDLRFERQIGANCELANTGFGTFNGVLDQLSKNAQNTTGITAAQKQAAIKAYASLHLPIVTCPH